MMDCMQKHTVQIRIMLVTADLPASATVQKIPTWVFSLLMRKGGSKIPRGTSFLGPLISSENAFGPHWHAKWHWKSLFARTLPAV